MDQLGKISNHGPFGCSLSKLHFLREKKYGLLSELLFKCDMCNSEFMVSTSENDPKFNINDAAVSGIMSIGCGYSKMETLFASLDVPCMSKEKYKKVHDKVCDGWEACALEEMRVAAKEESEMVLP